MNKLIENYKTYILLLVVLVAIAIRIPLLSQVGKDYETFQTAINILLEGNNPYYETLRSYNDKDITSGGYAYFPGILFTFYTLYIVSLLSHTPSEILWKIPNLLAELGVAYLLYRILKDKGFIVILISLMVWLFHPYLLVDLKYTYTDAIPIFFMVLSLYLLDKDDVLSGATFALAVLFKTFPIFIFPVYLLLSKNRLKFFLSGLLVGVLFSIPFLKSVDNFITYIKGSLFVHETRGITGRPFLFYISYYYKIEIFQIIPIKVYTLLSAFSGWLVILFAYFLFKIKNVYILSTIALGCFYLFTPVLNRTYLIWFLPSLLISFSEFKKKKYFYTLTTSFYIFYLWYLWQWIDGFHIKRPW